MAPFSDSLAHVDDSRRGYLQRRKERLIEVEEEIETGNTLVVGSTTASYWTSKDQGDSWVCLSSNLPPIYCARFA